MTNSNNTKWNTLQESLLNQDFLTHNPVLTSIAAGNLSPEQGKEVLRQYYYLVVMIVQFLTIAMVRIPEEKAKKELMRNLREELGSRTGGSSHQEILETLLRKELGIEARSIWSEATKNFISNLLLSFNTLPVVQVAGMIYALEATACPELLVVGEIINLAAEREVVDMEKLSGEHAPIDEVKTLEDFLAIHTLDFEVGHESGLRTTLDAFVSENWEEFELGFYYVISQMQIWWKKLAQS